MKIPMFSPVGSVHSNLLFKYSLLEETPAIKVEGKLGKEEIIEDASILKIRS